jgi:hypothetical protein
VTDGDQSFVAGVFFIVTLAVVETLIFNFDVVVAAFLFLEANVIPLSIALFLCTCVITVGANLKHIFDYRMQRLEAQLSHERALQLQAERFLASREKEVR